MDLINDKDETLMSICVETKGCFVMGPESGEPIGNCVFARLSRSGHSSASLASSDERDVPSLEYLYRLVFIEKGKIPIIKRNPISPHQRQSSGNANSKSLPMRPIKSLTGKIKRLQYFFRTRKNRGRRERLSQESIPNIHKPSGWMWKRAPGQLAAKSLEWIPWGEFLNMSEFNVKKVGRSKG